MMEMNDYDKMFETKLIELASDRVGIFETAYTWFTEQGPGTIPLLVQALENEDLGSTCHARILRLLQIFGEESAASAIIKKLNSGLERKDFVVINAAIIALSAFHTPPVTAVLSALLQNKNTDIVQLAAASLGKSGAPGASEPLLKLLDSDNPSIRYSAARALIYLEDPGIDNYLTSHLESEPDKEVRDLIKDMTQIRDKQ